MILPLILLVVSLKYFVFVALGSLWYTILCLLFLFYYLLFIFLRSMCQLDAIHAILSLFRFLPFFLALFCSDNLERRNFISYYTG